MGAQDCLPTRPETVAATTEVTEKDLSIGSHADGQIPRAGAPRSTDHIDGTILALAG
jgi:hypothetical protein